MSQPLAREHESLSSITLIWFNFYNGYLRKEALGNVYNQPANEQIFIKKKEKKAQIQLLPLPLIHQVLMQPPLSRMVRYYSSRYYDDNVSISGNCKIIIVDPVTHIILHKKGL